MRICSFEGCDKKHKAYGLCHGHNIQRKKGKQLTPIRPKFSPFCSFHNCNKKHYANGLCNGHYQQVREGKPLIPLYGTRNKKGDGYNLERRRLSVRNGSRRREERKAKAKGFCTPEQLEARLEYYGYGCAYCPGPYEHIDHVIPLSKGGTGWPANLVPACKSCNLSKAMKNVWEWLALRNSI